MVAIVLDTNIIFQNPKLLGLDIENVQFFIPYPVITELSDRLSGRGHAIIDLIEKSSNEGKITILNTDLPSFLKHQTLINSKLLSLVDQSIIASALSLKEKGLVNVKVATLDKEIIRVAKQFNVGNISKEDLEVLISEFSETQAEQTNFKEIIVVLYQALRDIIPLFYFIELLIKPFKKIGKAKKTTIQTNIVTFERKQNISLLLGIFIGIGIATLAFVIYFNLATIIGALNIWGTITAILFCGIILFILRERQRLIYGVAEFLIGAISIIILFTAKDFEYDKMNFDIDFFLKLLAGLYIMVRGQDNIVKHQKNTKFGIWLMQYGIGK